MVEGSVIAAAKPLSLRPEVRPTPLAALALENPPTELHFVRHHFGVPLEDSQTWVLELGGKVEHPRRYSLADLKRRAPRTQTVVLECAGHRRSEFDPTTSGLQWGAGAVSEARWTGVPLAELLAEASPTCGSREVLFEGADRGPHRTSSDEVPFARSMPLERALADDVLLAWEMNDRPISPRHGAPLRVIVPGSYAVASVKWLRRIEVLDRAFDGPFQLQDYQLNGEPLHELRPNSLIVKPEPGDAITTGAVELFGVAWGGRGGIAGVEFRRVGAAWQQATVRRPQQPWGLIRWSGLLELPPGEQIVEVRARDRAGYIQPEKPEWNMLGYANNSVHRVRVRARGPRGSL
jgi:DMSO/TMAO reductase YedYZ molybdopterin-dependent catalytic subunit